MLPIRYPHKTAERQINAPAHRAVDAPPARAGVPGKRGRRWRNARAARGKRERSTPARACARIVTASCFRTFRGYLGVTTAAASDGAQGPCTAAQANTPIVTGSGAVFVGELVQYGVCAPQASTPPTKRSLREGHSHNRVNRLSLVSYAPDSVRDTTASPFLLDGTPAVIPVGYPHQRARRH